MIIKTLIENTTCCGDLAAEHGLSLYIETSAHNILFDMGQSGAFADNAAKMGVDLSAVDLAVLSHGHYDHGGGIETFLSLNDHAPVYVSEYAFGEHYNGTEKYIGLADSLKGSPRLIPVGAERRIGEGLTLFSCHARKLVAPIRPFGLNRRVDGRFVPETFLHEQYLLIEEDGKRVLVSGCSHKGILNIAAWFAPDVLVGGFHLMKETDDAALSDTADALLAYPAQYYTGHCTGEMQFAALKARMGDRLGALATGSVITI